MGDGVITPRILKMGTRWRAEFKKYVTVYKSDSTRYEQKAKGHMLREALLGAKWRELSPSEKSVEECHVFSASIPHPQNFSSAFVFQFFDTNDICISRLPRTCVCPETFCQARVPSSTPCSETPSNNYFMLCDRLDFTTI